LDKSEAEEEEEEEEKEKNSRRETNEPPTCANKWQTCTRFQLTVTICCMQASLIFYFHRSIINI
jgi:hypothetical protein